MIKVRCEWKLCKHNLSMKGEQFGICNNKNGVIHLKHIDNDIEDAPFDDVDQALICEDFTTDN